MLRHIVVSLTLLTFFGIVGCGNDPSGHPTINLPSVRAKPRLPVRVAGRHSLLNETRVMVLVNECPHQLAVTVGLKRNGRIVNEALVPIPANGRQEVGWLEDFPFMPGDAIVLSHPDYETLEVNIPKPDSSPASSP